MKPIKQIFLFGAVLFLSSAAQAADGKLVIEPLYGVETALVRFPEPARYITRGTFGARVLYGVTLLSGELEYTEAHSNESYPGSNQKVEDKSQRLGVGIRSTVAIGNSLGIYARLGGRATQGNSKVTTAGVSENHEDPLHVNPYAGAGLQFAFASSLALNAGVTMIQNAEDKYDKQYTLGLTARFGNL